MNDIARTLYGTLPDYEKFVRLNELLSQHGLNDDELIGRFRVAGFTEEHSDDSKCRKLRFSSEFRRGKLPHVVALFCGREGRFVTNGDPAPVAQMSVPSMVVT
jgi:hypothetical protein